MRRIIFAAIVIILVTFDAFASSHVVTLKITNPNSSSDCVNTYCQVYVEIPAKVYIDKGWLRKDLENLRFNDGSEDLNYWVIDKKDENYHINKLGLWLLVYNLQPNSTKYINMIIDDKSSISYCDPGADASVLNYNRSSYECAAAVFPFYSYNLNDWKLTSTNPGDWSAPDTKFINNYLYALRSVFPGEAGEDAKTSRSFTIRIDNMKFYDPSGKYYSEAKIYFLSSAKYDEPDKLKSKPGYRLYIKKAKDFDKVSDDLHYTMRDFVILLQKKVKGRNWVTEAKIPHWYVYNNTRSIFDIKVGPSRIFLYINGKKFKFKAVNGSVSATGGYKRTDNFDSGHLGIDRMGWRLCCGTDINYIILRHYFRNEPEVEIYGHTDLVVGRSTPSQGTDVIELTPDVQRVEESVGGNTLDRYIFATYDIARNNQMINDFKLKIRNRGDSDATFKIEPINVNRNDWAVYWCDENGNNCSLNQPESVAIGAHGYKVYTIKVIPSPAVLFNGGHLQLNIHVTCEQDASFDNAEFYVRVNPKLGCYWKYKIPVDISWPGAHGYDNLFGYQVLIKLNGVDELSFARKDGSDIVVTDSFGNIIPFWIKEFNRDQKRLSVWVRVPVIYADYTKPQVYIWWGNDNFRTPLSDIKTTFDLYENWQNYPVGSVVGCPDGTTQCANSQPDPDGWHNIATPDDYYNWWKIEQLPAGNNMLRADMGSSWVSSDTGPYIFNGDVAWDHYEISYRMNAGPYNNYNRSWCPECANPQYNPVFVMDAGNMWGMEFFTGKFIFRPYASGIDYTWQYQTYVRNLIGTPFPELNKWYWVKVRVFEDRKSHQAYLKVLVSKNKNVDVDSDNSFTKVGDFIAPPVFSLPYGKIGFGGWNGGFYFDDIRVRKYVTDSSGKEPVCSPKTVSTLTPRGNISLSQPQVTPPLFEGRSAYIVTETKPFSWLGDVKAFYADCYIGGECKNGEDQDKPGSVSVFGKINDDTPKGLGYYLTKALPGNYNRNAIYDRNWINSGRFMLTYMENKQRHDFNGFDYFDMSNCARLKSYLGTSGTCSSNDNFTDETEKLIKFVRGFYIKDYPRSQSRNMDAVAGYGNNNGVPEDNEQWKLGDILHSNPLIVGIPNMLYAYDSYSDFVNNHRDRPLVMYFMSNDGMLHAFEIAKYENGRYRPLDTPVELWAYIPEANLHSLLSTTDFQHYYMADGLLRAIDVKDRRGWKTVLLGVSGKGGRYIFAIDITDPENPVFMWEKNYSNSPSVFDKIGMAISAPAMGKVNNRWVAIFGSGYDKDFIKNYESKNAYLTFVNILTGDIIEQVKVSEKIGNVLTDIQARRDKLGNIESIYFGDYYGFLWRVKASRLSSLDDGDVLSVDKDALFVPNYDVSTPTESKRPITAYPVIAAGYNNSTWVYFGTGDYDEYDPNYPYQRFYGLKDDGNTIYSDGGRVGSQVVNNLYDMTNSFTVNSSNRSWYIELGHTDTMDQTENGSSSIKDDNERVLQEPEVYGKFVFFATYQPFNNPCGGGKSRFYAVSFNSGAYSSNLFLGANNQPKAARSIELKGTGISSKPMIYTGHSGESNIVASGLVNSTSGELEKIKLNPNKFYNDITVKLWRRVR